MEKRGFGLDDSIRETPLETIGRSRIEEVLSRSFPWVEFKVRQYNPISIHIRYTVNEPGAPGTETVHAKLKEHFPAIRFNVPLYIDPGYPRPHWLPPRNRGLARLMDERAPLPYLDDIEFPD